MSGRLAHRPISRVSQIRNRRSVTRPTMAPQASRDFMRAREWHNPLRSFTLARAIQLAESYPRGEYADLMWTLGAPFLGIETADADLSAILSRRTTALTEMDWNVTADAGEDIDATLAADQVAAVKAMMNGIPDLYAAIEHLQLAICRGFSFVEILEGPGGVPIGLQPVDHWHLVRDGIYGEWKYNPDARQATFQSIAGQPLPLDRFIVRQVARPLGRIALIKYARSILSEADWGAFVERYGTPSGVVTMPPDVRPEDEAAYLAAAEDVANGGCGALPNGSDYKPNSSDKGSGAAPFSEHLEYWTKKLVLVGTNGMLTMLAESGSGTLAGNAHADTFEQLARGDARAVSEIINKQLVIPFLKKRYPGQPIAASWSLAFREEVDSAAVVEDAVALAGAGYAIDVAELSEKSGYKLEKTLVSANPAEIPGRTGRANPVQNAQDLAEGAAGVSGADDQEAALVGDSDAKINNRAGEGVPDGTKPEDGGQKSEVGDGLDALLRGMLSGSFDAWAAVLTDAVAEGAREDLDGGQRSEAGDQKEEDDDA